MSYACVYLHIPFPIKAIWEKVSGHSPLEGIATPFLAGTARLCPGQLISHPWWTGGFCRPEFFPHLASPTGAETMSHCRGQAHLDKWDLVPFISCKGQQNQEHFGYAASVSKIRERGFLPGPLFLWLLCFQFRLLSPLLSFSPPSTFRHTRQKRLTELDKQSQGCLFSCLLGNLV